MKSANLLLCLIQTVTVLSVKVKVIMHSEEDSRVEDEVQTESWDFKKKVEVTMLPFLRKRHAEKPIFEYEEEKSTTEKSRQHPNELLFPLIYRQSHINSMFKFGKNWYTWSTEKRADGSKAINYYICYDEPKQCDEIGWERADTIPKCAFQIESLTADDRACINSFGVETRQSSTCDGGELMKVSDIIHACGPRVRSLWRFVRAARRPVAAVKPADVNSLVCEDEEECNLTVEYRIHHDRITFSLYEPVRGQTFKSSLKRDVDDEDRTTTETHAKVRRGKKLQERPKNKKKNMNTRKIEGKGVMKEINDSGYSKRRHVKNNIKVKEDISEDVSG
ncbi:uncharacterized protein LOC123880707 [Maniola jurtina]|uniref:uncharacterized protein LOC123880707 n=1 Tax=Maniola jurtina TaxID=191418 RepID=UPI001E68B85D|nr:uncharacterized protein LOC123880707 [Maniola jurtina]